MILKDYQEAGVRHVIEQRRAVVILPTGTGKTLVALEAIRRLKCSAAVFCPKSLVIQWEKQIGDLPVIVIPITQLKNLREIDVDMIVIDEPKPLKSDTNIFREALRFKAKRRLILDATPIENFLEEAWYLFRWLKPNLFGALEEFRNRYTRGANRFHNLFELRGKLAKHVFAPKVADIREKVYTVHKVKFDEADDEYTKLCWCLSSILQAIKTKKDLRKLNRVRALISKIRSWLSDPERGASRKIAYLSKFLYYSEKPYRGIIFCYRKDTAHKIVEKLNGKAIKAEVYTGEMSSKQREAVRQRFNEGAIRFLVATSAGERGIDLPTGNVVIHFDLPWTFSAFAQRDRVTRVSSDLNDKSRIMTLIAENSVEEVMWSIICAKRDLMMVPFVGKSDEVYMHKKSWRQFIDKFLKGG